MAENETVIVKYQCPKGHINDFGFVPDIPQNRGESLFSDATETFESYCDECRDDVVLTRIGPQPQ